MSCSFRFNSNLRSIPTCNKFRRYGAATAAVVDVVVVGVVVVDVVVVGVVDVDVDVVAAVVDVVGIGEAAERSVEVRERESRDEESDGDAWTPPNMPIKSSASTQVSAIRDAESKSSPFSKK